MWKMLNILLFNTGFQPLLLLHFAVFKGYSDRQLQ